MISLHVKNIVKKGFAICLFLIIGSALRAQMNDSIRAVYESKIIAYENLIEKAYQCHITEEQLMKFYLEASSIEEEIINLEKEYLLPENHVEENAELAKLYEEFIYTDSILEYKSKKQMGCPEPIEKKKLIELELKILNLERELLK